MKLVDEKFKTELLKQTGLDIKFDSSILPDDGVIAKSLDGRITYDNRFIILLYRKKEEIRSLIYKKIYHNQ
jgi:vacuolar-type H+-ATPase subunit E/Vma4